MYFFIFFLLLARATGDLFDLDCVLGCECQDGTAYCASLGFKQWPYHPLHHFKGISFLDISDNMIDHLPTVDIRINFPDLESINVKGNKLPCYVLHYLEKSATVISDCASTTPDPVKYCPPSICGKHIGLREREENQEEDAQELKPDVETYTSASVSLTFTPASYPSTTPTVEVPTEPSQQTDITPTSSVQFESAVGNRGNSSGTTAEAQPQSTRRPGTLQPKPWTENNSTSQPLSSITTPVSTLSSSFPTTFASAPDPSITVPAKSAATATTAHVTGTTERSLNTSRYTPPSPIKKTTTSDDQRECPCVQCPSTAESLYQSSLIPAAAGTGVSTFLLLVTEAALMWIFLIRPKKILIAQLRQRYTTVRYVQPRNELPRVSIVPPNPIQLATPVFINEVPDQVTPLSSNTGTLTTESTPSSVATSSTIVSPHEHPAGWSMFNSPIANGNTIYTDTNEVETENGTSNALATPRTTRALRPSGRKNYFESPV